MSNSRYYQHHNLTWTDYPSIDPLTEPETSPYTKEQGHLFHYNRKCSSKFSFYEQDRNILINAQYDHINRIIGCRPGYWCNKRFFCPSCSRSNANKKYDAIAHIPRENLHLVTISHITKLGFQSENYIKSYFFKTIRNKVKKMRKSGLIEFFLLSQEFSIRSLYPKLTVNPHIHMIVMSSQIDEVVSALNKKNLNIHVEKIAEDGLPKVVRYLYKPVNLAVPYSSDYYKHPFRVNKNITSFVENYTWFIYNNHQVIRDCSAFTTPQPPYIENPINVIADSDAEEDSTLAA